MLKTRNELHTKLVELLGSTNVYYQPPESLKLEYPAIIYSKEYITLVHADNSNYFKHNRYTITVIDKKPDNPVIDKLLDLQHCSFDRHYKTNNLNHDVLTLYY